MSAFKNVIFAASLSFLAMSSYSAHFVRAFQPRLVNNLGTNEVFFMSNFTVKFQNHDNSKLVVGGYDGTFEIVDITIPNKFKILKQCRAYHGVGIKHVNFSPSGNRIIATSMRGTVTVWDLEGNLLSELEDPVDSVHLATFGSNDDEIITNSISNINKVWTIAE